MMMGTIVVLSINTKLIKGFLVTSPNPTVMKYYENSSDSLIQQIVKTDMKNYEYRLYKMKILVITILLGLCFGLAKAQKVDSLLRLLNLKGGTERIDILYELAYEYVDVDYDLGLKYATQAFNMAKMNGDSLKIVKAGKIKSLAFEYLGKMDSSIAVCSEILPIATRNDYIFEIESILNVLGLLYMYKAEYDKALQYHYKSLQLREKDGSKSAISIALNNIGLVFYKMKDYDKALIYYNRTLELRNEEESKQSLAILLINISLCHGFKSNFTEATDYVNQAFEICGKNCSKFFLLNAYYSLGVISFGLNNFSEAESQFLKSYGLANELEDERLQLDNLVYLSQIFVHRHQMIPAERYLKIAEELIASGTPYNLELIKIYYGLFALYNNSRDFEKVAMYQQKYIQLKDSIYSEELTRNLMRVESEYLERENKAKIDAQSQILALNEEIIFRQRILNIFTGIIALLLAVIIFILFKNNRQKHATNLFLEQKVRERTLELEKNNDALLQALEQQAVVFQKVSTDFRSFMATIKGLCTLGLRDTEESYGGQYIRKIEATSDELLDVVSRILSPKSPR